MTFKKIFIWIIVFFVLILILQNVDMVELDILFWTIQASLLLVILLSFLLGILLGWLLTSLYLRRRRKVRDAKHQTGEK